MTTITVCDKAPRHKLLMLPRTEKCPACGKPFADHKTVEIGRSESQRDAADG